MRTHAVNSKPRLRWVMIITRMMHSEIDSPRSRTFCSHRHVSSSIGLCQLPFDNRRGEQPVSFALDRADVRSEPAWPLREGSSREHLWSSGRRTRYR